MKRVTLLTKALAHTRVWLALVAVLVISSLSGCGGGEDVDVPDTAAASGVVSYQGKAVNEADVTFHPQGKGHPGVGRTDADGRFVLTTYDAEDGAVVGTHAVTIRLMPTGGLPGMEAKSTGAAAIPQKYADPSTSPLTAEVKPDEDNEFKFELQD